jgi:signal transduction histidine kinase/streptogramin lyase
MARDTRGEIWLGTVAGGLFHVDASGNVSQYPHNPADPHSIAGDTVDHILEDHAQNIWAATWGGLSRLDRKRGTFVTFRPQGMNPRYLAAAEDATHRLWLGTHLHGLQRFDPATGEFVTYAANGAAGGISNGRVNAIHVGHNGLIWAGTQNGLDAVDPITGKIRNYGTEDGLPGSAVSCILEDDEGGLWLGTSGGIARLDPRNGDVRAFTRADGLPGLDFTGWGSCHRGASKDMYFAGFTGATSFDPAHVRTRSHVSEVQFTDLVIAGVPFPTVEDGVRPAVLPDLRALTLPYSRNSFSAAFTSLSYANPKSNRYRFRLAGLEEQWHVVGSDRRVASYNSLPPGSYRLEVQGVTGAGPWSEARSLSFTILEPWWETSAFRIMVAVFVIGLAWLTYDLRARRVARQFEMRLNERVAERTRIARELHDSLLQGFHALMYRLQAVRNLLPTHPQHAAQALDEALDRGDKTVEQARVAVTDLRTLSIEPDLETALRSMGNELPMIAGTKAPELRIAVEGKTRAMIPLVRDDVLQVAREAFRNAVTHASANLVQVHVNWGLDRFSLSVRDDGVGLDPKLIAQGRDGHWGLQGMRERTRQIGGRLEIQSEAHRGTRVELSIPAARVYSKVPV